jgi:hypothetical protein
MDPVGLQVTDRAASFGVAIFTTTIPLNAVLSMGEGRATNFTGRGSLDIYRVSA